MLGIYLNIYAKKNKNSNFGWASLLVFAQKVYLKLKQPPTPVISQPLLEV